MHIRDALALIGPAVPRAVATWADLGAGSGTFTAALAEILEAGSRVHALDRDEAAVASLRGLKVKRGVTIVPTLADFAGDGPLPGLGVGALAGLLFANSLHFVADAAAVLTRLVGLLEPGGRVVIIEYDRRPASRWVPFPIPQLALPALASAAGLSEFTVVATRPSRFSGMLYAASAVRLR